MADLISREAALAAIDNERNILIEQERLGAEHIVVHHARRLIEDLPAVDAAPVVHAQWVDIPYHTQWDQKMCSACGDYFCCQNSYCPNCGAKMDGERRDEREAD